MRGGGRERRSGGRVPGVHQVRGLNELGIKIC